MQLKPIIQALAVVWLVLFVASFVVAANGGVRRRRHERARARRRVPDLAGDRVRRRGARRVRDALRGRRAASRASSSIGYVPLALSVFLVASFIALMGFRFYVAPLFE